MFDSRHIIPCWRVLYFFFLNTVFIIDGYIIKSRSQGFWLLILHKSGLLGKTQFFFLINGVLKGSGVILPRTHPVFKPFRLLKSYGRTTKKFIFRILYFHLRLLMKIIARSGFDILTKRLTFKLVELFNNNSIYLSLSMSPSV